MVIVGLLVALLALGALPGLIKTGDPYYVEATAAAGAGPAVERSGASQRGDVAYLREGGERYRLEIVRVPEGSG